MFVKDNKDLDMRILIPILLAACSILASAAYASVPPPHQEYAKCLFTDGADRLPYRMLSPEKIEEGARYPLVIFLHGSGERGTDNESQLAHGASLFSNPVNASRYPAYVVFPQCKEKTWTGRVDESIFMPGAGLPDESRTEELVVRLVDDLIRSYPIDLDRIYIVGISMGAIATYDLVCRYPSLFAAAVPICGAVNPDRLEAAKNVSFMIFHGEEDDEIPSICSREAYRVLHSAGADVDYVEFAGTGHDCWTLAFNTPTLLPWLFAQTKD